MLMNNLINEFNRKINLEKKDEDDTVICDKCNKIFENRYAFNAHILDTDCFHFKGRVCRNCLTCDFELRERIRKLERELYEKKEYIKVLESALINPDRKIENSKRNPIPNCVRQNLWFLYFGKETMVGWCQCCGREVSYHNFHIAHKIALKNGGNDCIDNLTVCCANCNLSMSDRNFFEFKNQYYSNC